MKFSRNWLCDFVDIKNIAIDELVDRLTMSGFEVESVQYAGEGLKNIVSAKIEKIVKHPNADALQICQANIKDKTLQIITRATNVFEGAIVPLALEGAVLPNGLAIAATKMRGESSLGMFCGKEELGLSVSSDDEDGIYILDSDVEIGLPMAEVLGLNDYILDVTILSNRPDCNSIYALAKEIGAIFDLEVCAPALDYPVISAKNSEILSVNISSNNCYKYMANVAENVKIEASPLWMQNRLQTVGIRPINNVVDITNYVLTEIGQPMHAFNLEKIEGNTIVVRQATNDEKFVALNEQQYNLDDSVMAICDKDKPIALAGVMGGLDSGVDDSTTSVVFESASFARGNIRSTVRKFGLSSDSSSRFERGVVPAFCSLGLKRALHLLSELCDVKIYSEPIEEINCDIERNIIKISVSRINNLLGIDLSAEQMVQILSRLDIECTKEADDVYNCLSPQYRNDLETEQDIAEEVVRLYGFENVSAKLMDNCTYTIREKNLTYALEQDIRKFMIDKGFNEVISLPLENVLEQGKVLNEDIEDIVHIANPLSAEFAVVRKNPITSLLNIIKANNARSNKELSIYEIAKAYAKNDNGYSEKQVVIMAQTGKQPSFYTLKGICEDLAKTNNIEFAFKACDSIKFMHPYKTACILLNGKNVGYIGQVHPMVADNYDLTENVVVAQIDFDAMLNEISDSVNIFKEYSKFQPVVRDFTFLVPEDMEFGILYNELISSSGKQCVSVRLKDVYRGENVQSGYKSVTVELIYEKIDATFTDEEMQNNVNKLLRAIKYKLNVTLKDEI